MGNLAEKGGRILQRGIYYPTYSSLVAVYSIGHEPGLKVFQSRLEFLERLCATPYFGNTTVPGYTGKYSAMQGFVFRGVDEIATMCYV